ncbi:GNAT family N-acetyltransferase [Jatrophihabitans telluris]|uniref:GNAT family N-acetyltransferase n=1 Tax=Jatrophihabitans telluris TaxID=2038343 RepID=A0ABY4R2J5_9ACTN|nr:GNAT family N-acetyltransferase [Jatrophihabitans telluris]
MDDPDTGRLRAAVFHGGNLIPVGNDPAALQSLAEFLSHGARGCSSIVGDADAVAAMWPTLSRGWGTARAIRDSQPLLASSALAPVSSDPRVRTARTSDARSFLPAAVAMFTEELGVSPIGADHGVGYRQRVDDVIASGRAYVRLDAGGRVEFKAEIGALSTTTAQVQGVWVRPELRGHGLGTRAMAAVLRLALHRAPTVSLYVNDFNIPARRMYERLGMVQVGTLRTVLF